MSIEDLRVNFYTSRGNISALRGVSFDIAAGTTLGLVGESGSGKSITAMSILGLIPSPGRMDGGTIRWQGRDITSGKERAKLRGRSISIVFQDPMTNLNPLVPVGRQITEVLKKHKKMNSDAAEQRAIELLDLVGIPSPDRCLKQLPFELSGGMCQRVMIAIALAPDPELLLADEPTTALDVTIQAQILELIGDLQKALGVAMVLITHDLGVVAGVCDNVAVMYAGKVVEQGSAVDIFESPKHPYTAGLLASMPRLDQPTDRMIPIGGAPPDLSQQLPACPFALRCPRATDRCTSDAPDMTSHGPGRKAACWHAL